jgi:SAM-dependent methyltransferase
MAFEGDQRAHRRAGAHAMMSEAASPSRVCPSCGARESIEAKQPVWPVGWQCAACRWAVPDSDGIPLFAADLADTISGFDPAAFDRLTKVEDTHFWFVARNELIVALAQRYFPNARRYLEIGCGNGAVLQALEHSRAWDRIVATDLHPHGLAHARARLAQRVEFAQLDARAIPAEAGFDLVGAYDIIEHVADDEAVLRAMRRAIAPGGGALVAVPQHPALWSRADEIGHHQRRYRRGELEHKLERNGFAVTFSSSYTAILLPLMAASRLTARFLPASRDADVFDELKIGPRINGMLTSLLRAEIRLTLAGMRWPFGGSRIIAARVV